MSRWNRRKHDDTETALANFSLTFAKALLVFCVILFVMITDDSKKEDGIRPKVDALIIVNWSNDARVDVDTWVRDTEKHVIYYGNKEGGIVFLDRDDLGMTCSRDCEEIVSLRGTPAGEYVVNLNLFYADGISKMGGDPLREPTRVHVRIIQMNPSVMVLWEKDVLLRFVKEEKHVVRFWSDGKRFVNFDDTRPVMLQQTPGK